MTTNDTDVILIALKKEREIAHQKVMQLDRIIKKIKEGKYSNDDDAALVTDKPVIKEPERIAFPKHADIKVQVLKVFDALGKASKFVDIQAEYNRMSEGNYPIRDTLRGLQQYHKIKLIKEKGTTRGFLWAKAEWIEDNQLKEEYKPEGFDMLYKPENLLYE